VGVDVRGQNLALKGWTEQTDFRALDFISYLDLKGIRWVIYTDISRDGTLQGPDMQEVKNLSPFSKMNMIFSGGMASAQDLMTLKEQAPFLWGVIVGKALYEGKIVLKSPQDFMY
jgi:phosphoribosylformimino-5-aminoimidazole carboxamide ribotide isomerase